MSGIPTSQDFVSSPPSVVKSIRQRDLLNCWLRLARASALPGHADFQPDRLDEELVDMMVFEVVTGGAEPRFLIHHEGRNLTLAYGNEPPPRRGNMLQYLDDAIGPIRYASVADSYLACVHLGRPIYSVARVRDVDGKDVDYERLLMPFAADGALQIIVGSYKTISLEGRFEARDIMSFEIDRPVTVLRAVIREQTTPPTASRSAGEELEPL